MPGSRASMSAGRSRSGSAVNERQMADIAAVDEVDLPGVNVDSPTLRSPSATGAGAGAGAGAPLSRQASGSNSSGLSAKDMKRLARPSVVSHSNDKESLMDETGVEPSDPRYKVS